MTRPSGLRRRPTTSIILVIQWGLAANLIVMLLFVPRSSAKPMPDNAYLGKLATAQIEMPKQAEAANIQPMNWLEARLLPGAAAVTWPWGRIGMHEGRITQSGLDPGDVMAHELTHIGQTQRDGMIRAMLKSMTGPKDYLARPYEQEALQAEAQRPVRRSDIHLPIREQLRKQVQK